MTTHLAFTVNDDSIKGWVEPIPLDSGETPTFPTDALPGPGRDMVQHVAEIVQVDPALPAAALLGAYATAIQRRITVKAQSQKEETPFWIVAVAEPSERKSSAFSPMFRPVYDFEQSERERMKPFIAETMAKRKVLESRISRLEQEAGKAADATERTQISDEIARLSRELEETPGQVYPRLIADNITEEMISVLMEQQGERLALVSAEPTVFQQMAGSRDRKPVLDILKAYSGEPLQVDRVSRGNVALGRPCLSVVVAAQPGAVREFMGTKRFEERGVLSRFSFVPCQGMAGTRLRHNNDWNPAILDRYGEHVRSMLSDTRERELELSPEALELFAEHSDRVEIMQRPGGDFDKDTWAGKQPGRALRLAAALHCADGYREDVVFPDTMLRALELSDYLIQAALFMQGMIREPEEVKKAKRLLHWMTGQDGASHTLRDVYRGMRRSFPEGTEEVRKHMQTLVNMGHVRRYEASRAETYMLNPCYWKQANSATNWDT